MKLAIKTVILQEMVSKAIKGASLDKMIPLTSLMSIKLADKKLTLSTTDASNYLYIIHDAVEGDDFEVVVYAEQFAKLISKLSSENTTITLEDKVLNIKANGNYKIELPLDENGEIIHFPDPIAESAINGEVMTLALPTVKTILNTNKASLAIADDEPIYKNYYVGDRVVTSDFFKICSLDVKLFNKDVLISPETMNLLDVMTADKIEVYIEDDVIRFMTKDCIVYGHTMEGVDDFAIKEITELVDEKFKSSCKINKSDILSTLDRILLFVGPNDKRAITLTFTEEGIDISSKQSNGVETVKYVESKKFKAFTCQIDIMLLIDQIKANSSDTLELYYGNDKSIKFTNDKVVQLVALFDDTVED